MMIYGLSKLHIFIPFDLLTLQRNYFASNSSNVINKANTTNLGVNYGKQSCYKKYEQSHENVIVIIVLTKHLTPCYLFRSWFQSSQQDICIHRVQSDQYMYHHSDKGCSHTPWFLKNDNTEYGMETCIRTLHFKPAFPISFYLKLYLF